MSDQVDCFRLTATDGRARTGLLRTAHGVVRTPVFMPVGTKATVKATNGTADSTMPRTPPRVCASW